ncbi:Stromal membrane-associated protein 1 [Turdus rufiventris]|nr:Stromal membrane-associated protein 1 [Turdus rufiventris]
MATRSCREKAQKQNEQHQAILAKLLREEDNKYCADCEAKEFTLLLQDKLCKDHDQDGLLGTPVFLSASDVLEYIEILGFIYQGSSLSTWINGHQSKYRAVEFFIRDKYEKKKYYDKNAVNAFNISSDAAQPLASSPSLQAAAEKSKAEKEKEKKKEEKKKERESEKPSKQLTAEKPQKKEDQQSEAKASPKKSSEPTIDLLGLDGPAEASVANGGTAAVTALNDDLDIFGPMISNPLPAAAVPPAQSTSTKPAAATLSGAAGDLDLFTEQTTKSEESAKKQLSKDSILSLYGTGTMQQQNAPGMFMGSSSMPFTTQPSTHFQGFPAMGVPVPAATGMMGNMMGQSVPVMGQSTGVMVGVGMPNGFTGTAPTGVMGLPQTVVGPQGGMVGQMVTPPQNKYGLQQNQQAQWNLSQMNQQMAGMNLSSSSNVMGFGQPPNTAAGWTGSSSGQTLSTQLWK